MNTTQPLYISVCVYIYKLHVRLKNNMRLLKNIPARDPKQCVVWILKGKVERTQKHINISGSQLAGQERP